MRACTTLVIHSCLSLTHATATRALDSCCVANSIKDFVGAHTRLDGRQTVNGIGKQLRMEGKGHVAWTLVATNGTHRTLKLPCLHVPSMTGRIASMQAILSTHPKEQFIMDGKNLALTGHGKRC